MNLTVGFSSIATLLEFAPSDPTQQTPLSPPIPLDAPPTVTTDVPGIVNTTVLADGTIQFDGIAAGTVNATVSASIGGTVFTTTAPIVVAAVVTPAVGSIALSFGAPFATAPLKTASAGFSVKR